MTESKRPMGRPTKYESSMCDVVIELGKTGASQTEMACELGIHWTTFEDWRDNKPEFSDAVRQAVRFSQAWWEKKGREATFGECQGFNATSYIFNMKNRFSHDWKDRLETNHTSSDGSMRPTVINLVGVDEKE
jgi:hypothetical protein